MLCSALSVMVNAGECSAAEQIVTHSPCGGPHWDWGRSYPVSSAGSREHGTSRADVLNILQLRELFKGVSYKGHSGQQLQHYGWVFDSQTP